MTEPTATLEPTFLTSVLSQADGAERSWYAVYTCPRHEKRVAEHCTLRAIESFLPLYETVHRWQDRLKKVALPLFPGYLFVRIALEQRLRVLQVPSVVEMVSFSGGPAPVPDTDIESLRQALESKRPATPYSYINAGQRMRVRSGPLAGLEGIVVREKSHWRLVLSVDLIQQAVAVELDVADVQPSGWLPARAAAAAARR